MRDLQLGLGLGRDGVTAGPATFDTQLELIASAGAEKLGSVQCTANNDVLIHWDSLDDVYRFADTGTHLYRAPVDGGGASSAPDSEAEGVRLSTNLTNATACENFDRTAFTIIIRTWIEVQGAGARKLWNMWFDGPDIVYNSAGTDTMVFDFPGATPATLTLTAIPEGQMVTVLMRWDGVTAYAAVYDEDGTTVMDSDTGTPIGLTSGGDTLSLQTAAFHVKRAAAINGFTEGTDLDALLEAVLTDDPLPAA